MTGFESLGASDTGRPIRSRRALYDVHEAPEVILAHKGGNDEDDGLPPFDEKSAERARGVMGENWLGLLMTFLLTLGFIFVGLSSFAWVPGVGWVITIVVRQRLGPNQYGDKVRLRFPISWISGAGKAAEDEAAE